MANEATLTIQVPRDYLDRLTTLAESTGRSTSLLASEALAAYLSVEEWQVAAIREALAADDSGEPTVDHAEVDAWLKSWGPTTSCLRRFENSVASARTSRSQ